MSEWAAASNGGNKRHWYVMRKTGRRIEMLTDKRGDYRRFATMAAAQRLADQLNREQVTP